MHEGAVRETTFLYYLYCRGKYGRLMIAIMPREPKISRFQVYKSQVAGRKMTAWSPSRMKFGLMTSGKRWDRVAFMHIQKKPGPAPARDPSRRIAGGKIRFLND